MELLRRETIKNGSRIDCGGEITGLKTLCENSEIPPTGVGGWFRSNLQTDRPPSFKNSTNGSWWIVQIQPIHVEAHHETVVFFMRSACLASETGSEPSTNCRWWDSRTRFVFACRLDLNHPPISVGGISEYSHSP
jgi:hypothetical protein